MPQKRNFKCSACSGQHRKPVGLDCIFQEKLEGDSDQATVGNDGVAPGMGQQIVDKLKNLSSRMGQVESSVARHDEQLTSGKAVNKTTASVVPPCDTDSVDIVVPSIKTLRDSSRYQSEVEERLQELREINEIDSHNVPKCGQQLAAGAYSRLPLAFRPNTQRNYLAMFKVFLAYLAFLQCPTSQMLTVAGQTAFTAFDDNSEVIYGEGEVIHFGREYTDFGNNYDPSTSIYTCPVTGIYTFSTYSLVPESHEASVVIVIDTTETGGYHQYNYNTRGHTAMAMVIAVCNEGDAVFVRSVVSGSTIAGYFDGIWTSSFNGVLLQLL